MVVHWQMRMTLSGTSPCPGKGSVGVNAVVEKAPSMSATSASAPAAAEAIVSLTPPGPVSSVTDDSAASRKSGASGPSRSQ